MSSQLRSVCARCQTLFDEPDLRATWLQPDEILNWRIDELRAEECYLCAIICAQHREEQLAQSNNPDPESGNTPQIAYSFRPLELIHVSLKLVLTYSEGRTLKISLPVIAEHRVPKGIQWTEDLPPNTLSSASINFLRDKLKTCLKTHDYCGKEMSVKATWHPTRLLCVRSQSQTISVTLVDGNKCGSLPYFSLSHCWGGYQPLQLTSTSEKALRSGLPVDGFPKTFRDAFFVCLELGVCYLWIDSLCIFQDSSDDKTMEISMMWKVYTNALCNIAATSASNAKVGLSFPREAGVNTPFWVKAVEAVGGREKEDFVRKGYLVLPPGSSWADTIDYGPLNNRAWVVQENMLSARVLHFTRSQVLWECYEDKTMEMFPRIPTGIDQRNVYPFSYPWEREVFKRFLGCPHSRQEYDRNSYMAIYAVWHTTLDTYTQCFMANEEDRLPAISALVEVIGQETGDQYVAGLWRSRLLQELLWIRALGFGKPMAWRRERFYAPTWSWASCDFPVRSLGLHSFFIERAIASATLQNLSTSLTPTLTLRGELLSATLRKFYDIPTTILEVTDRVGKSSILDGLRFFSAVLDDPSITYPYEVETFLFTIYELRGKKNGDDDVRIAGLVLKSTDDSRQVFERAGVFYVYESAYDFYRSIENKEERSIQII